MVEAQRNPRAGWGDPDVTQIVRVLRDAGPVPLWKLGEDPELADWPSARIEHAIVSAWSRGLIFIDTRDLLVAL